MRYAYIAVVSVVLLLFIGAVLSSANEVGRYFFYGAPINSQESGLLILLIGFYAGTISKDVDKGFSHIAEPQFTLPQLLTTATFFISMIGCRTGWSLPALEADLLNVMMISTLYTCLWFLMIIGPWNNIRGNKAKEQEQRELKITKNLP